MKVASPPLLPLFRSPVQGRMLAEILLHPDDELSMSELSKRLGTSLPTVVREVRRAEGTGLVETRTVGRTRLVRAVTAGPLYPPLRELLTLTFGVPAVLADELGGLLGIESVYVFGSWAARHAGEPGREPADIDVLVVGSPDRDGVYEAAERAERSLRRPVNVTFRTSEQWQESTDPFLRHIRTRPLVPVLGAGRAA